MYRIQINDRHLCFRLKCVVGAKQSTEGSTVVGKVSPKRQTSTDTLQLQEKPTTEAVAPKSLSQLHILQSSTSNTQMPVSPPRPQIPQPVSPRPPQLSVPPVQHIVANAQSMPTVPPSTYRVRGQLLQQQQRWQLPPARGPPFQFPNNGTPR